MEKIIVHIPREEELARIRMGGKFNRPTLAAVVEGLCRDLTREMYGCTEGTIELVLSHNKIAV